MPINLFFIFYLNVLFTIDNEHKFYVSTTSIEYKVESKSLQIISQLFTDDIESIIRQQDENVTLDPDSDEENIDQLIAKYLKKTLIFSSKGKQIEYDFLGKQYLNDITKCFIELKLREVPNELELQNKLLLSLFENQQNIIHFKNLDKRKSYLLHRDNQYISLILKP